MTTTAPSLSAAPAMPDPEPPIIFVSSPQARRTDYAPAFFESVTFRITEPEHGLAFLRMARPDNLAHVRRLAIFVDAFYATGAGTETKTAIRAGDESDQLRAPAALPFWVPRPNAPAWYALLKAVRTRLPGLRALDVYLDAELTGYHQDVPRLGAGDDAAFAKRLARLRGLQTLRLDGFFAREWPAFLERELGLSGAGAWSEEGRKAAYLELLARYQGYCSPCDF